MPFLSSFALCSRWLPLVDPLVSFAEHTLSDIMQTRYTEALHKTDVTLLAE